MTELDKLRRERNILRQQLMYYELRDVKRRGAARCIATFCAWLLLSFAVNSAGISSSIFGVDLAVMYALLLLMMYRCHRTVRTNKDCARAGATQDRTE